MRKKRVAILISGRGSNMSALIAAAADPAYPAEVIGVICSHADASGLENAARANIPIRLVAHREHASREAHDEAVRAALGELGTEIVCLAGYMRLLTPGFVKAWEGRMINIHPSLLPLFKGTDSHAQALAAGTRIHGCSVHFVTNDVDSGPIIAQAAVPVFGDDTQDTLASRVLAAEHKLYPLALALVAEGKVRMSGSKVVVENVAEAEARAALFSPAEDWRAEAEAADLEQLARFTP
jgi:formyltetrahydrofolate-dependent phosphoribosylglycinamide formyltransferase